MTPIAAAAVYAGVNILILFFLSFRVVGRRRAAWFSGQPAEQRQQGGRSDQGAGESASRGSITWFRLGFHRFSQK